MASRTKRALWGVSADIFWTAAGSLSGLIATPIILSFLPKALYGFWIAALSVLGYLGMLDLSIGMALTHFVARLSSTHESESFEQVVNTAFFSFLILGVLVFGLGWSLSGFIPKWFHIPPKDSPSVILAFRIIVVGFAISLPLSTFGGMIKGSQRMAVQTTIARSVGLAGIVLSILLLYLGFGLSALALSQIFSVVIGGLISYLFCKHRYFPGIRISIFSISRKFTKSLWTFGGYFQFGRIANTISLSTDAILIAVLLGASAVPTYSFTSKLVMLVGASLISKVPIALFPALSQMYSTGETAKIRGCFVRLSALSIRIAVVFGVFLFIANREFINLWVGSDFYGGDILNIVFISWLLIDSLHRGTGVVIQASGNLRNWSIMCMIEALLNIGFSLALAIPLGLIGIALGTTISRTLSCFYIIWLVCQQTQFSIGSFITRGLLFPVIRSLPSCCAIVILGFLIPRREGWLWLFIIVFGGFLVNIFSFEGIGVLRHPGTPVKERIRYVFALRPM